MGAYRKKNERFTAKKGAAALRARSFAGFVVKGARATRNVRNQGSVTTRLARFFRHMETKIGGAVYGKPRKGAPSCHGTIARGTFMGDVGPLAPLKRTFCAALLRNARPRRIP